MRKPVTIITGFLGAGKTTFLNYLLKKNIDTRYAIIENEFGEQGIDNKLVYNPDDSIIELNNGCLCCTLNDNLYDILNELHERQDEFDEIIIEATGVADPAGLAQPFVSHPLIKKHFPLINTICLVDAELIEDHLMETEEAKNQIAFSDVIMINKTDLVHAEYLGELTEKMKALNPLARVFHGHQGNFPAIAWDEHQGLIDVIFEQKGETKMLPAEDSFPVHKPHHHHHHDHTDVVSETFVFTEPFDYKNLYHYLFAYLNFQAKDLYRMKGLVHFADKDHQHVIQSVGKRIDFQEGEVWLSNDDRRSVIVFIGKSLKREGLQRLLDHAVYKAETRTEKVQTDGRS